MRLVPASCGPSGLSDMFIPTTFIDGGNPSTFKHAALKFFVCPMLVSATPAHVTSSNFFNISDFVICYYDSNIFVESDNCFICSAFFYSRANREYFFILFVCVFCYMFGKYSNFQLFMQIAVSRLYPPLLMPIFLVFTFLC
jgi:hypothetical protein